MAHDAFPSSAPSPFDDDITLDQLRPVSCADDLARAIGADASATKVIPTGLALDAVIDDVLGQAPSWAWWLTRTRR